MKQVGKSTGEAGKSTGEREFKGLVDVYVKTFKADGFGGLYRGFVISFIGIFIYRGFYFGLYDTIMPYFSDDVNVGIRFCVSYSVTVLAGLLSYPVDTIRRRMMMTSGGGVHYDGSFDCAKQILEKEGWKSYFKGAGANIMRGIAGALVLAGFDVVKKAYVQNIYGPEYEL
jgi:solute carrier family 25 (adenine nucleotide translocator) protein 4/5/6/31